MDIRKFDKWLMNNAMYSQEEREIIIEAVIEYMRIITKRKRELKALNRR